MDRSNVETEYRAMAHTTSEMMWVQSLLHEMRVMIPISIKIYCDNQSAIFIASNLMCHERTKHIKVDSHFIRDLVIKRRLSL